ncbi:hypothetical protein [Virgibacillus ihumii]|uniref:hypothetical protein n=1 Tax=Virgibacillus ihumii TaxID=2686091 RepID=UPI00157D2DF0|nr:hypothetical protein [Virgibacillus ihumii]
MTRMNGRYNNGKVVHVASGSDKTSKSFTRKKAKRFDENNRLLKEALLDDQKKRTEIHF